MKTAYVIGRFQPFHIGHQSLVNHAFSVADRVVICLGDTGGIRSFRDPWTPEERESMIRACYPEVPEWKLQFVTIYDYPYNDDEWAMYVRGAIRTFTKESDENILVGMDKDHTSFYLHMFPEMKQELFESSIKLDATEIRRLIFSGNQKYRDFILPESYKRLRIAFKNRIFEEYEALVEDEKLWHSKGIDKYGPQPKTAVDACIETRSRVLLVVRGGKVGYGGYALPGGYLDPSERLLDGALRELAEETGIKIAKADVPRCHRQMFTFDHPQRSPLSRTITHVLNIKLPEEFADANKPVPGDDAQNAFWFDKSQLTHSRDKFFSDHWHIATTMSRR